MHDATNNQATSNVQNILSKDYFCLFGKIHSLTKDIILIPLYSNNLKTSHYFANDLLT